jgi:ribonuclease J
VPSGIELVDQAGIVHDHVMQERQQLAEDGVVTVAAAIDWEGQLVAQPEIHLRGVVTTVEQSLLQQLIIRTIERILSERWEEFSQSFNGSGSQGTLRPLREEIESNLQRLIRRELQGNALVVFLLQAPTLTAAKTYRRRRPTASAAS